MIKQQVQEDLFCHFFLPVQQNYKDQIVISFSHLFDVGENPIPESFIKCYWTTMLNTKLVSD